MYPPLSLSTSTVLSAALLHSFASFSLHQRKVSAEDLRSKIAALSTQVEEEQQRANDIQSVRLRRDVIS